MTIIVSMFNDEKFLALLVNNFGSPTEANPLNGDEVQLIWQDGSMELAETLTVEMYLRNNITNLEIKS